MILYTLNEDTGEILPIDTTKSKELRLWGLANRWRLNTKFALSQIETVFLGIEFWVGMFFATMISWGINHWKVFYYNSLADAKEGHNKAVRMVTWRRIVK